MWNGFGLASSSRGSCLRSGFRLPVGGWVQGLGFRVLYIGDISGLWGLCRVYIEIMETNMETTIVYWGYVGIMEKRMETTGMIGVI